MAQRIDHDRPFFKRDIAARLHCPVSTYRIRCGLSIGKSGRLTGTGPRCYNKAILRRLISAAHQNRRNVG
jgi:hypothetical protein